MTGDFLDSFARDLRQEILARSGDEASPRLREEAFTEHVLELLSDHNEAFDWELCFYHARGVGRVPAAKANAWSLSGDGATLDLFTTLFYDSDSVQEVGKPEVRHHIQLLRGFLRRAIGGFHVTLEESSDAFRAAHQIYEARDLITTVRLFFLTDGMVRSMDMEEEPLEDLEVKYVVWDIDKLSHLTAGSREVIELDFEKDYGGSIPCLQTAGATTEYCTYLAFIPAALIARIYGTYGQRLLERNVRAFLQARSKINKGLQKTLRTEPHRFLAYNNGLCCTAEQIRVTPGARTHVLLQWARDFQIVNGGQTTASIYHAVKKDRLDLAGVAIQMKLTVLTNPEDSTSIVPLIAKYANSQNKVNTADLAANGKYHRDVEACSRTVWAPAASGLERGTHWYYERARGSYQDDKGSQETPARVRDWVKQNPLQQKITKTDLAKFEHAWLGLPHLVCRGAEKNFKEFADRIESDGEPLVDETYFRRVVAKAIIWRSSERIFDTLNLEGYRANSVAYSVAWLAERSGRRIDLEGIWRTQRLSAVISDTLRIILRSAHSYLTGQSGNVGEASKRVDSWQRFSDAALDVGDAWMSELTGEAGNTIRIDGRRSIQSVAPATGEVMKVTADHWFGLASWAKEHGFLLPWQRGLAFSLGRLATKGRAPTAKQTAQALIILERARDLGYQVHPD